MKKTLKILGWVLGGVIGLVVVYAVPELQPWVVGLAAAYFVYKLVDQLVEDAVRRALQEDLRRVRQQSHENSDLIVSMDRKISAIWDRIRHIQ